MRILSVPILLCLWLVPSAAHADPQAIFSTGGGGVVEFDHVSSDGCVHTHGQIFLGQVWNSGSAPLTSLATTGLRELRCTTGLVYPFYGSGPPDATTLAGLAFIHGRGHIHAGNDRGDPPFDMEVDLSWFGRGPVTRTGNVDSGDGWLSFVLDEARAALTAGTLSVDGTPATLLPGARLLRRSNGQLQR